MFNVTVAAKFLTQVKIKIHREEEKKKKSTPRRKQQVGGTTVDIICVSFRGSRFVITARSESCKTGAFTLVAETLLLYCTNV